ncbi:hypothetical protein GGX14DRAFT_656825 [Mycena pura]|uniref:Uncharacterized protein n=1 Tax=Mycena pura TaxID=153505 RepID=A0AAD6YBY4_9AGAR|nr:hypothetical protein GGX14DRAFT_656825 [Mycena pura]
MEYNVPANVFADFWNVAEAELLETMTEMLFYGILLVLVAFAANLLWHRQASKGNRVLAGATGVMFMLATVQLIFRLCATEKAAELLYLRVAGPQDPRARDALAQNLYFNFVEDVLLVTNNLVTDGVLIYRCFLIWGGNYYAVAVPSLMLLLTTGEPALLIGDYPTASGPVVDLRIGFLLGVLTNILIVGLSAGRMLHTRRRARSVGPAELVRKFNNATAMILESGAIVFVWVLVYIILRSMAPPTIWRVFRGGLAQLLNIAPTMIVVRVGLGYTIGARTATTGSETWNEKASSASSAV